MVRSIGSVSYDISGSGEYDECEGIGMHDDKLREICEQVRESELVLVGLGEEFQYDWHILIEDERYHEIEEEIGDNEEYVWIIPFLQKMVLRRMHQDRWRDAYRNLRKILEGKNYFVVSLCMDDYIYDAGLIEDRIVTPCGGFRRMQCDNNCSHMLSDIPEECYDKVLEYYEKKLPVEELHEPVCDKCGGKLRFNQIGVSRYAEEGYLKHWNDYIKWLQGTVNKKLCVLELGVGMEYPSIIRFPFEKVVFYNRKAHMYRVHRTLYQMGEGMEGRGIGIAENPIDFLLESDIKSYVGEKL